jgi:hypothetical protein
MSPRYFNQKNVLCDRLDKRQAIMNLPSRNCLAKQAGILADSGARVGQFKAAKHGFVNNVALHDRLGRPQTAIAPRGWHGRRVPPRTGLSIQM